MGEVEVKGKKLEEKMFAVREKLKDIISFINKDGEEKSDKNDKKVVQDEIKSILEWQPSAKVIPAQESKKR